MIEINLRTYWRFLLQRTLLFLLVWFLVGYVMSIFFIEPLNEFTLGGMPFGFWMAQQGSIFVFVLLIFSYALLMDRLDTAAGVRESDPSTPPPTP